MTRPNHAISVRAGDDSKSEMRLKGGNLSQFVPQYQISGNCFRPINSWTTMKSMFTFLLCLASVASLRAAIPTPDSAMAFHMEKDPRKWTPQYQNASKTGFIMEFVPQGDSIKKWKEMAAQQIAFTQDSLR